MSFNLPARMAIVGTSLALACTTPEPVDESRPRPAPSRSVDPVDTPVPPAVTDRVDDALAQRILDALQIALAIDIDGFGSDWNGLVSVDDPLGDGSADHGLDIASTAIAPREPCHSRANASRAKTRRRPTRESILGKAEAPRLFRRRSPHDLRADGRAMTRLVGRQRLAMLRAPPVDAQHPRDGSLRQHRDSPPALAQHPHAARRRLPDDRRLFALASLITVVSIVQLGRAFASDERLDHLKHRGHQLSIQAGDMYRQQERIIHGDGGNIDAYAATRDATRETARALAAIVPPRLRAPASEVATLVDEMDTLFREHILPAVHTDRSAQATQLEHRSRAMVERVMHVTDQLIVELERESAAAGSAATAIVPTTIAIVLSCLIIAIAVALVLGVRVTRSIDEPVRALQQGARSIASGDLTTRVDARSADELGELAASFNQMAADLSQQQDALVEARKLAAIGQLAAGFAHEINNPLGVIHGHLRLLQERVDRDEVDTHERLTVIGTEVDLCRRTVQELLDLARPLRSTLDEVSLRALFDEVIERAKPFPDTRIELTSAVDPVDLTVTGDPARLRQLMSNLIANAAHGCGDGGRIEIRGHLEGEHVILTVVDDGAGIAADDLPHIFEPFYTSKSDGTGIGLFLCEAIVRAHGGTIVAASTLGKGTKLTVQLRT